MWLRHWSIDRDPFEGPESPYVPLPSHEEAIARLVHVIEISRGRAIRNVPASHDRRGQSRSHSARICWR